MSKCKYKFFQRATPVHVIGSMVWTAESFRWALSKGFDLFNLIENNLAIDKNETPLGYSHNEGWDLMDMH